MTGNFNSKTEFCRVDPGVLHMGSTLKEVNDCVAIWSERLIKDSYLTEFQNWILKEYPAHQVRMAGFFCARFPVMNGQYKEFLAASVGMNCPESIEIGLPDDHPVWGVSLVEVLTYIKWRSAEDQRSYRLLSEAEWEWAARGPTRSEFPWGNFFDPVHCNTYEAGHRVTTAVDAHPNGASCWGVEDLAGNVEEWTSSTYVPYPGGNLIKDDLWQLAESAYPILRGGSFALGGDLARCARRHGPHPGKQFRMRGFRLAMNFDEDTYV